VSPLSSPEGADAPADEQEQPEPQPDELREGLVARLRSELGDAVVDSHIDPGRDLWVRVDRDAWRQTAETAHDAFGCTFFDFLSAIDWLPSPFGRDMDAQEDLATQGAEASPPGEIVTGYAGGDTRFQLLARVAKLGECGITFKADLPDGDLRAASWVPLYAGADWHEREAWEMFGITFDGHPGLRHIYLPSEFEGHPLRKDFPLLARRVKPWPGIVDVEPMPGEEDAPDEDEEAMAAEGVPGKEEEAE
jgi:NADH-quinone oxidoreductase subunit C